MRKKISGIYIIHNTVNNKYYIGQSSYVQNRLIAHKNKLTQKNHPNQHLQASWNKYGEKAFTFSLLEEWPIDYLISMENYWCSLLNTHNNKFGFNRQSTGISQKFYYTEKQKEKLITILNKQRNKKVVMLDSKNNFIQLFNCPKEASLYFTDNPEKKLKGIRMCLSQRMKSAYGYVFIYQNKYNPTKDYTVFHKKRDTAKISSICKTVYQFNKSGKLIKQYKSESEANRFFNKSNGFIKNYIKAKYFYLDFAFSYSSNINIEEYISKEEKRRALEVKQKEVYQLDANLKIINSFSSPSDVLIYFQKSRKNMRSFYTALMKNKHNPLSIHKAYGFYWVYKENYNPELKVDYIKNNKRYYDNK